jgi:hypothetical protein
MQVDSFQNSTANKLPDYEYDKLEKEEVLFVLRQDENNFFGATLTPIDPRANTWEALKKMVIDLLETNTSIVTLVDSSSSIETIGGLTFQKLYLKTEYPGQNITRKTYWFYRRQKNREFSINVSYSDSVIGKQYLDILTTSSFKKS